MARDIEALVATQLAALTAERDALLVKVERLEAKCLVWQNIVNEIATSPEWEFTGTLD